METQAAYIVAPSTAQPAPREWRCDCCGRLLGYVIKEPGQLTALEPLRMPGARLWGSARIPCPNPACAVGWRDWHWSKGAAVVVRLGMDTGG